MTFCCSSFCYIINLFPLLLVWWPSSVCLLLIKMDLLLQTNYLISFSTFSILWSCSCSNHITIFFGWRCAKHNNTWGLFPFWFLYWHTSYLIAKLVVVVISIEYKYKVWCLFYYILISYILELHIIDADDKRIIIRVLSRWAFKCSTLHFIPFHLLIDIVVVTHELQFHN